MKGALLEFGIFLGIVRSNGAGGSLLRLRWCLERQCSTHAWVGKNHVRIFVMSGVVVGQVMKTHMGIVIYKMPL